MLHSKLYLYYKAVSSYYKAYIKYKILITRNNLNNFLSQEMLEAKLGRLEGDNLWTLV